MFTTRCLAYWSTRRSTTCRRGSGTAGRLRENGSRVYSSPCTLRCLLSIAGQAESYSGFLLGPFSGAVEGNGRLHPAEPRFSSGPGPVHAPPSNNDAARRARRPVSRRRGQTAGRATQEHRAAIKRMHLRSSDEESLFRDSDLYSIAGAMKEESLSVTALQANECLPKKPPVLEGSALQFPFSELHGEATVYVGRTEDAIIALSTYRLHIQFRESTVNVPLRMIEHVECRDVFQLHVTCKDGKVIRCQFSTFDQCQEWLKRLVSAVRPPSRLEELFCFAFHSWCLDVQAGEKGQRGELCGPGSHVHPRFRNEVERMGFNTERAWRVTEINRKYRLCSSYPQLLIVPAWITDNELESVAAFRSWKRFPAVVYRHRSTGAVIARCGQPEVSWWGWRNADDERLAQSIAEACCLDRSSQESLVNGSCPTKLSHTDRDSPVTPSSDSEAPVLQAPKLLIMDARSYAAAVANRAKGGGCECPEYYPSCEVLFMGMANIHAIRRSFASLRLLCTQTPDPANWLSALEGTKWLQHLSVLLKAALLVVNAVHRDQRPVMVHCSDGWDRTPQIVALSKMLLDPYYRTIEWLDCVHQLQRQFPCSFQFNEAFLVKLAQHTYSCLFGTFLCNSCHEREEHRIQERTCSVWSLLRPTNPAFLNILYSTYSEMVLLPVFHVRSLLLWNALYLPISSPRAPFDDACTPSPEDGHLGRLPKMRSFDDLAITCEVGGASVPTRRSSDPSLKERQEHRRSLDISVGVGPEGGGAPAREGTVTHTSGVELRTCPSEIEDDRLAGELSNGEEPKDADTSKGAELSVEKTNGETELLMEVGVAQEQMEHFLQEASEDDDDSVRTPWRDANMGDKDGVLAPISGMSADLPAEEVEEPGDQFSEDSTSQPTLEGHHGSSTNLLVDPPALEAVKDQSVASLSHDSEVPDSDLHPITLYPPAVEQSGDGDSISLVSEEMAPPDSPASVAPSTASSLGPDSEASQPPYSKAGDEGPPKAPSASRCAHPGMQVPPGNTPLQQMEEGHRQEVETLRRQMPAPDADCHFQPGCRSRCSAELLSEASWEGANSQDAEATSWYPEPSADPCYGCESRFWLTGRKHHCRAGRPVEEAWNCGNVFCASCCAHKVAVQSQHLVEPSRVCGACYGSLRLSAVPAVDLELEKPIAASSN
nr:myotubularin-related protein 3-like isoform X2 [Paramormyrops kingsleyae]